MKTMKILTAAVLLAAGGLVAGLSQAQPPGNDGIGRFESLRHDMPIAGSEAIQVRVDFAKGASFPMHTHPGVEIAYVIEGSFEYKFGDGKKPVTLKAGDSLFIPAGQPHSAHNVGAGKSSELATYIVEKGKPVVVKQ